MQQTKANRPAGNGPAQSNVAATNKLDVILLPDQIRCTRCGHVLTAPKSVARERGPVCATRVGDAS